MPTPRVVVVGGGVSGLVAARALARECDVVLLEATSHFGGKLETSELLGRPIDLGPDAFITRASAGERLCRELGLGDELIAPGSNSAAIFSRGALRQMPRGIVLGVPTSLRSLHDARVVSMSSLLRAALDLIARHDVLPAGAVDLANSGKGDLSVAEVFGPRLGDEILRTLIDPLLGGINASDVDSLSIAACAPQLMRRLEGKRSILRALRSEPPTFAPGSTRPPFLGLEKGMASLADALRAACERAGVDLRSDALVIGIEREHSRRWHVELDELSIDADAVLLATPSFVSSRLLAKAAPDVSSELVQIPYASVVTACFSFDEDAVPVQVLEKLRAVVPSAKDSTAVLAGSGVLVPRDGQHLMTGATFTSSKWPRSAAAGQIVIRTFAGRHADARAISLDETALQQSLLADLRTILGIEKRPQAVVVERWPDALPQYITGHLARVGRITLALADHPGLGLCGAAYTGIGIPACIDSAEAAAARILEGLKA